MKQNLKYKNITISGLPGAGSSTLGKALANVLNWDYFSGGDFMRQYAIKKGLFDKNNKTHHDATVYADAFDRHVDSRMRKTLKTKSGKILESWISSFMAQGIEGVLKILVFCSDDAIRVDRIVNRDNLTINQAKKHLFEREEKNLEKWRRMYKRQWQEWIVNKGLVSKKKPIWFWYPELFDLTIDTYKNSKEETLKKALYKLGYKAPIANYEKIFASL
jgi:cytidylate kinase